MPRTEAGDILLFVFLLQFSNQPNLTKRQKKKSVSVHKPSHIFLYVPRQTERG